MIPSAVGFTGIVFRANRSARLKFYLVALHIFTGAVRWVALSTSKQRSLRQARFRYQRAMAMKLHRTHPCLLPERRTVGEVALQPKRFIQMAISSFRRVSEVL